MTARQRGIEDLEAMGVPIEAERGVGHRLRDDDIPGWFTEEETSAILLRLGVMKEWSDKELADATTSALGKIGAALPSELPPTLEDKRFKARLPWNAPKPSIDLAVTLTTGSACATRRLRVPKQRKQVWMELVYARHHLFLREATRSHHL